MVVIIKHDDLSFYISLPAIKDNDKEVIGFYFDNLSYPQSIIKKSFYGEIAMDKIRKMK